MFDELLLNTILEFGTVQKRVKLVDLVKSSQSSFRTISNEYLLAKFGFDTAENEPLKVCQQLATS